MVNVMVQLGALVGKHACRFFKRHAVPVTVGLGLVQIPDEEQLLSTMLKLEHA
jgi:hypothetical protein